MAVELPYKPTTIEGFVRLMEEIWEPKHGWNVYERWHDARKVAKECGMGRTGGSTLDGKTAQVYRFLNNLKAGAVKIVDMGDGLAPTTARAFSSHKENARGN